MKNNKNIFKQLSGLLVGVGMIMATIFVFGQTTPANAETLNRQLSIGMSGSDVSALQSFLAKDSTIYPQGLVTGYFGVLTRTAVMNFQRRNGIDPVGRVGPLTLAALNLQMSTGVNLSAVAPNINSVMVNSSRNSATVSWNTSEPARGVVYFSSNPLVTFERENSVDVSGNTVQNDTNFHTSQNVLIQNLLPNTTYYYLIYVTDQDGNVSVTWPTSFQTAN